MSKEKLKQIQQAAIQVFAEKGFAEATIAEIAETAGIGKGTIYEYFKSKEALLEGTLAYYMEMFEQGFDRIPAQATALDKITFLIRFSFSSMQEMESIFPVMLDFWTAAFRDPDSRISLTLKKLYNSYVDLLTWLIRQGQEQGQFRTTVNARYFAMILFSALDESFIHRILSDQPVEYTTLQQECETLVREYLVVKEADNG